MRSECWEFNHFHGRYQRAINNVTVLASELPLHSLYKHLLENEFLQISVSDLSFVYVARINSIKHLPEKGKAKAIIIETFATDDVLFSIYLQGRPIEDDDSFEIDSVNLEIKSLKADSETKFIASSLKASMLITDEVYLKAPGLSCTLQVKFNTSLRDISYIFQYRQVAYKLMVIEQATGTKFELPSLMNDEEIDNINFIYKVFTERSFLWPTRIIDLEPLLDKGIFEQLAQNNPKDLSFVQENIEKTILGENVLVGREMITMKEAIIKDMAQIRSEIAQNDIKNVRVKLLSLSGQALYKYPDIPQLADIIWDKQIMKLINLEDDLDRLLVERYNNLAASTLAGLTEEEKEQVTSSVFNSN